VMSKLNEYICENAPSNRFVTLFYGELDPRTGALRYANAGHNHPILVRKNGQVERLVPGGLAIGIAPEEEYEEGAVTLEAGDALVIFSDGISEATNPEGEEFGDDRIVAVARTGHRGSASALRDAIEEAVSQFVGAAPPHDDTTLMIVMRAG
jgi:phosphoserine phosphatase RsbU/P